MGPFFVEAQPRKIHCSSLEGGVQQPSGHSLVEVLVRGTWFDVTLNKTATLPVPLTICKLKRKAGPISSSYCRNSEDSHWEAWLSVTAWQWRGRGHGCAGTLAAALWWLAQSLPPFFLRCTLLCLRKQEQSLAPSLHLRRMGSSSS